MYACYSVLLSCRRGGGSLISLNKQVNWAVYCLQSSGRFGVGRVGSRGVGVPHWSPGVG